MFGFRDLGFGVQGFYWEIKGLELRLYDVSYRV